MPIIRVLLNTDSGSPTLSGFNNIVGNSAIGTGLLAADLLDDQGNPTGISLTEGAAPFTGFLAGTANADDTPDARFPTFFFRVFWHGSAAGEKFLLAGFAPGAAYTLEIAGHNRNSRSTLFSATNSTPTDQIYQVFSDPDPDPFIPEQPIAFTGTADASGEISISAEIATSVWGACNGFILTYDQVPDPTATLSGNLQPGASFTVTYSDYDAIPVSPVTIRAPERNGMTPPPLLVSGVVDDVLVDSKHSGTIVCTYPALPTSGTIQGLPFGEVEIEVST